MTAFFTDELQCDLPPGFIDRSTHLLEWKLEDDTVSIAIQRDLSTKRLSPEAMNERALAEYARRFPHYLAESVEPIDLSLDHAIAAFRWKREGRTVFQIQCYLELGDRLLVVTVTGLARSRSGVEDLFREFVRSIELRGR
jgi:hypothetical protein